MPCNIICHIFQCVSLQCLFHSSLCIPHRCIHGLPDIPPDRTVRIGIGMKVKERCICFFCTARYISRNVISAAGLPDDSRGHRFVFRLVLPVSGRTLIDGLPPGWYQRSKPLILKWRAASCSIQSGPAYVPQPEIVC